MTKHIAVLLTVHNRKAKTLACLKELYAQTVPEGYTLSVYLTDDGCTDGTPEEVVRMFPTVRIIKGDGNLYWNRGMYQAWAEASKTYDYDYYLWLNDDTILLADSLRKMIDIAEKEPDAVIVGPTRALDNPLRTTYSGIRKDGSIICPNGEIQYCHTFNGNIVMIPRKIFHRIGNLDYAYHHALGDLDYGQSVIRAGFKNCLMPEHCGMCNKNPINPDWIRSEVPFIKRWKNFHSPLAYGEPKAMFHYNRKNYGLIHAIKVYITNHIRVFMPSIKK